MKRIYFSFLILLIIYSISINAQSTDIVYLCVQPTSDSQSYLVGFKNTTIVGFIFSENSTVTVFGKNQPTINAALYNILTDAQTGGYRRNGSIAVNTGTVFTDAPVSGPTCDGELPEGLLATNPFTVTTDQALVIEVGGNNKMSLDFIGSVALHFIPEAGEKGRSLQLIQFEAGPIDMTFPFVKERTFYTLIANKEVAIKRSYFATSPLRNTAVANDQEGLAEQLQVELGLKLYDIMEAGRFRFYPAYGFADEYFPTGFISIEVGDSPAKRSPEFAVNQQVVALPLEGIAAQYFLPGRTDASGSLQSSNNPLKVKAITGQGDLIVEANGQDVSIEAWYVEVVE